MMTTSKFEKKSFKINKKDAIESLYLTVLGLYLLKLSFDTTLFYVPWPRDYEWILFIVTCGVAMLKVGYSEKYQGARWLFCVLMGIAFGLSWWHTQFQYLFLLYIPVLIAGAIDINYKKILKVSFWINFSTLFLAFFGSCTGVIEDLVYEGGGKYRHAFGIAYPTDFAARLFYLLVIFWVLYDKVSPVVTMALAVTFSWFGYYYCNAKCSTITLICFLLAIAYYYLAERATLNGKKAVLVNVIDRLMVWSVPVFAAVMLCLTAKFDKDIFWLNRMDSLLTNRLSLGHRGIENYGFSLFGTAFEQIGGGGTVAQRIGYNFIDSTYILTALRYGIIVLGAFLAINVVLGGKALARHNRRLLIALAVIGLHSIVEHHMPEINYDIFMILPFTAIGDARTEKKKSAESRQAFKRILVAAVVMAIGLAVLPLAVGTVRTLVTLLRLYHSEKHIYFIAVVIGAAFLLYLFVKSIVRLIDKAEARSFKAYEPWIVAMVFVIFAAVTVKANMIITNGIKEYSVTLAEETDILKKLSEECKDVKVYVDDVPEVYDRQFGSIADRILPVETCTVEKNIVVIAPKEKELSNLLSAGYYFGEVSNTHAIYTNDEKVVGLLEDNGVGMAPFYSVVQKVDMAAMAEANGLEKTEDGGLLLQGSQKSIIHGPWISLYKGPVQVNFEVQLINDVDQQTSIGTIEIASDSGMRTWCTREVIKEDLDNTGYGTIICEAPFYFNVDNVEFLLFANDGVELEVKNITFYRTGQ